MRHGTKEIIVARQEKSRRKRLGKAQRAMKWTLSLAAAVLICAYILVSLFYQKHFYPGTIINGEDFSNADKVSVSLSMMDRRQNYSLQVTGRDLRTFENVALFQITAQDIDLTTSIREVDMQTMLKSQKNWLWPIYIWGTHTRALPENTVIDEDKLTALLEGQDIFDKKKTTPPADAYIEGYSKVEGGFVLKPEVKGTQLHEDVARESIHQAIMQGDDLVNLEETESYLEPSVTLDDAGLQQSVLQANKWLESEITYDWNGNEVVLNGERIKEWIILKNGLVSLDEEAVAQFVKDQAREYDTYGKYRTFHTTMGYDLKLPGGAFGWLTDREAEAEALTGLIKEGAVCEREPEYTLKGPQKGASDIGSTYVEADMTHQHLYLYQKGEIVLETDFVSGDMNNGNMTPEGVFGLTYKTTNAVLRGADYETPVTYWMPFNGNFGMHDATWRTEFGGDIYLSDGSHGCLNLPLDKAGEIYQYMTQGFPIICYYYPPGVLPEEPPADNWGVPDDDED